MIIENLLRSTKPIIYETSFEEFPYAFAGTCYPIKYNGNLFIVSAFHCYKNHGIEPKDTRYPISDDYKLFFAFDSHFIAQAEQSKDDQHHDQVILSVAKSHHPQSEIDQINALDLAVDANSCLPTSNHIMNFWIHGYPFSAPKHGIDYDHKRVSMQAYSTNGCLKIGKADYDFCYSITMKEPIPSGMHPNGMSGSPLYAITNQKEPVYCGTIILFDNLTHDYIAIGPEILVNALRKFCNRK